jgi:hypothetical protein
VAQGSQKKWLNLLRMKNLPCKEEGFEDEERRVQRLYNFNTGDQRKHSILQSLYVDSVFLPWLERTEHGTMTQLRAEYF